MSLDTLDAYRARYRDVARASRPPRVTSRGLRYVRLSTERPLDLGRARRPAERPRSCDDVPAPAGAGRAAGGAAAIYLIHLLHGSRRRRARPGAVPVGRSAARSTGRERRRWPPLSLLLILQLLVAALAALALARPASSSDPPRHLALILDASASMQATDVAPNRFAAAQAKAVERLAVAARPPTGSSLIRAGADASLVVVRARPETVRGALPSVAGRTRWLGRTRRARAGLDARLPGRPTEAGRSSCSATSPGRPSRRVGALARPGRGRRRRRRVGEPGDQRAASAHGSDRVAARRRSSRSPTPPITRSACPCA